jgi:hypothetical protein
LAEERNQGFTESKSRKFSKTMLAYEGDSYMSFQNMFIMLRKRMAQNDIIKLLFLNGFQIENALLGAIRTRCRELSEKV